jgi:tripeptide aminopeptidase
VLFRSDEAGNVFGILTDPEDESVNDNILLVAHTDTLFDSSFDHTVSIGTDSVAGAGLGDNALGLATLATLPIILADLEIRLKSRVILMGAARSLGRGDLEGLRFFLDNKDLPIRAGICVEGLQLGRLSYASTGMVRGEIRCAVPDEYDWAHFGASGAIHILNDIITRISEIPLPRKPRSSIVLGMIRAGAAFNRMALNALLRFEIRSDSAEMVEDVRSRIEEIVYEAAAQSGAEAKADFFGKRIPGGIPFSHPLVRSAKTIMGELGIEPRTGPSISELSAFLDRATPAITIGITRGEEKEKHDDELDTLRIEPVFDGVTQLIGLLLAIDNGLCHED